MIWKEIFLDSYCQVHSGFFLFYLQVTQTSGRSVAGSSIGCSGPVPDELI